MGTTIRFRESGEDRMIVGDDMPAEVVKRMGFGPPQRASHIEPINKGLYQGYFFADMSPSGYHWQFCLWPPKATRRQALTQERDALERRWIKGDDGDTFS